MRTQTILLLLLIALAKLAVVIFVHVWSVDVGMGGLSPIILGGDDGITYRRIAGHVAETGRLPGAPNVWPLAIGLLMHWMGLRGLFLFKAFLFVASVLVLVYGLRLLDRLSWEATRQRPSVRSQAVTLVLLGLFPTVVYYGSFSIYRDLMIYASYLACAYYGYEVFVRRARGGIGLVISLGGLFAFRWYAAVAFVAGTVAWLGVVGLRQSRRKGAILASGAALGLLMLALLVRMNFFADFMHYLRFRQTFEAMEGGSTLGIDFASATTPWGFLALYAYSFVSNAVGPLPFQVNSLSTLVGFVFEVPVIAYALYRVFRGQVRKTPGGRYLLLLALAWFGLIAIYNDNLGTALRLRVLGMQLVFLVFACELWVAQLRRRSLTARRQARPAALVAQVV
ncbi:hypothetical protein RQM47_07585 [Rubrivirga sp. S365]|uniref:Glycosyltransferase RgtA/B/C/D-like domain-containing protein n=1 Tax=Rubrivirga litoralis TaxID=3075598 RepID=A0ABU3BR92_9BACT|nr:MULTISPECIES: hypothetical protein [unclassified Rubrivirga]MDT0631810.1 hypothetical protein [Rubrivirga sp. F394]MDT7856498.1 hypothetical protein [Rubrivirga sp. S365]